MSFRVTFLRPVRNQRISLAVLCRHRSELLWTIEEKGFASGRYAIHVSRL